MEKFVAILRKLPRILFVVFFMTFLVTSGYYACSDDTEPKRDGRTGDVYIPTVDEGVDGMTSD